MSIKWIHEEIEEGFNGHYRIDKLLCSSRSKFQSIELADLKPFGRTLLLDGLLQSSEVHTQVH